MVHPWLIRTKENGSTLQDEGPGGFGGLSCCNPTRWVNWPHVVEHPRTMVSSTNSNWCYAYVNRGASTGFTMSFFPGLTLICQVALATSSFFHRRFRWNSLPWCFLSRTGYCPVESWLRKIFNKCQADPKGNCMCPSRKYQLGLRVTVEIKLQ